MGCRPRVDGESLRIPNIGQVRDQLEAVNDLRTGSSTTFDTKAQNTSESALEISLSQFVRRVALEARVGDPRNVRVLLQPLCKSQSVERMSLRTQAQSLDTYAQEIGVSILL